MTRKRSLTPEEEALWQEVTRGDRKLSAADKKRAAAKTEAAKTKTASGIKVKPRLPELPLAKTKHLPQLGAYANIDRNTAEKLKRGHYDLDATLDLHGMTRDKAEEALKRFIASHYRRGSRALLIITGKGKQAEPGEERRGVLRELLPRWLGADELAGCILAFDTAQPRHGGSGAFYVLLRRKR